MTVFRGREIVHMIAAEHPRTCHCRHRDVGKVEQEPRAEGRTLQMLLTPVAKKSGAADAPAQKTSGFFAVIPAALANGVQIDIMRLYVFGRGGAGCRAHRDFP